jgi:outer membrane protein
MTKRTLAAACALATITAGAAAQGTRATVDLGVAYTSMGDSTVDSFQGAPPQASIDAGSATSLLLSAEFLATPNIGVQLSTTLGGTVEFRGAQSIAAAGELARGTLYAGTLFVNWHFFDEANALRPFLGVGVNYTSFSGVSGSGGLSANLSNSWSAALQGGARYAFDRHWSVVGSIGLNWARTDLELSGAGVTRSADVSLRPVVATLGVGYSF